MSDMTAQGLVDRRKRLIYRSTYTGIRETDLLLGAFARAHLPSFDPGQLDRYEALLTGAPDAQIFAWAIGRDPVPAAFDTDVMTLLKNFKISL